MTDGPGSDPSAAESAVPELVVDGVTVRYGDHMALDRFDLEVARGEVIAVLGPSGSGKSTLLRAVAGLEPVVEGRVLLGGRDLAGVPTHRRGLGLMFQDHGLFAHLDVGANVEYGLRIAGIDKPTRRSRVAELLELVGLTGFERRGTDQLSGGEAQRVALARALAPQPGLLMLDEPLGSLDRALRDQLSGDLRRMLTDIGQTALHVTHDQAEAFAVADRVVVVADGRPVAVGAPAELWADPGTRFVAEFLGHPNLWTVMIDGDGTIRWGEHLLGLVAAGHPLRAPGPGLRTVVVPATAIVPMPGGSAPAVEGPSLEVHVTSSVFRQGLTEVTATVTRSPAAEAALQFTTSAPVPVGGLVTVVVDCGAMRPIVNG